MKILLCNDDGIDSPFLRPTIEALRDLGELKIVVPSKEQSWISRAFSRHNCIEEKKLDYFGYEAYTISGTPSDCVNIALEYLCEEKPDIVFSGINVGSNITMPLLLSSGTFAGALEGAGNDIASFAVSLQLKNEYYQLCRIEHRITEELENYVNLIAKESVKFIRESLSKFPPKRGEVFNINFPSEFEEGSEILECELAKVKIPKLYYKNAEGKYDFKYKIGDVEKEDGVLTDLDCLTNSRACYSKLNIYKFGRD